VALAADAALILAALSGAGVEVLTPLAVLGGASTPPVSPSMRALWPELVGRKRLLLVALAGRKSLSAT